MIRVAEFFAGVGGFRVGLERAGGYEVVFTNGSQAPKSNGLQKYTKRDSDLTDIRT